MNDAAVVEALPGTSIPGTEGAAKPRFLPDLVVKNTFALYGVQAGRKLIPLASIPYLARVLGPTGWGEVAFVTAMAELIVIVIEFGFNLSATRSIARYRNDAAERGRITAGVLTAQTMLATVAVLGAIVASRFIPLLLHRTSLLAAGLVYAVAQGFNPLWYFQGMERIRLAAALEVGAKAAALGALFVFVHQPQDAWRALAIQALSPIVAVVAGIYLAFRSSVVCRPQWALVHEVVREGWHMFLYRSAESLYGVGNSFLLGLFAAPALVGFFSASEKISKAAAGLVNPIRESLYPRVSNLAQKDRNEAFRLARIGTWFMVGAGLVLSTVLFIFAHMVILVLMGRSFEPAATVLKILSPIPLLLAITFSSGQLWLIPHRRDKIVSHIVFCAAILNLGLSFYLGRKWAHIGMASTVLISESAVAVSMLWSSFRFLDRARTRQAAA
ncbi:MAG TPA: flippase [Bryobacteraceae bacterium]|nr:flippase [Bryobacteraceae bacterium]